jgi:hypothetical protein
MLSKMIFTYFCPFAAPYLIPASVTQRGRICPKSFRLHWRWDQIMPHRLVSLKRENFFPIKKVDGRTPRHPSGTTHQLLSFFVTII